MTANAIDPNGSTYNAKLFQDLGDYTCYGGYLTSGAKVKQAPLRIFHYCWCSE
ncbi:hypothetical protein ACFLTS_07490 [Chloroflexota bacterium]